MPATNRDAPVIADRGVDTGSLLLRSSLDALNLGLRGGSDRALARSLEEILAALQHDSVSAAIRLIDRAWRTLPACAETLAPIYGRLLSLEDREHDAALRLLNEVGVRDADVAGLTVRAYLRLLRTDDAKRYLDLTLKESCLEPGGLLEWQASKVLRIPDLQTAGWLGLGPTLDFYGELAVGQSADALEIRVGGEALPSPCKILHRDGRILFTFQAPQAADKSLLHVSSGGVPLLGSPRRLPLDFALDGRADSDGHRISGWARLGWLPTRAVQLSFEDEKGRCHRSRTRGFARPGYRWPFRIDARSAGLTGSRLRIAAQLPDGRWQSLPDAPLLLDRALRSKDLKRIRLPRWPKHSPPAKRVRRASRPAAPVDVLIPVYGGGQETLACIDSVLASVADLGRLIVVDDATEDAALVAALDELAAAGRISLLRNDRNLGFVNSVNRALALGSAHDVVLLNSDTLVFGDWLQRLRSAAYSASRVGTVTPLSNSGSIASYPHELGSAIDPEQAAAMDKLAAWTHPGVSVEAPVGVGFCLYLRNDCLQEVGELDAAVFGVGYGEESDFCMRARARGWSHRIAADVFVYHASGGSFGTRRAALMDRSNRLLNLRYTGYDRYIRGFMGQDPLLPLRRRLDERRLSSFDGRFVLLVTLALEGGVERFVTERGQQIRERGLFPLVLKPRKPGDSRWCELSTDALEVPNLRFEIPADLPELTSLLSCLRIEEIEIQHFLDLDAGVIDTVRSLGVPYDVVVHDYSWICPRVTLIDGSGRYCREPAVSVCRSCVRKNGSRLGETISVPALRARSAAWLGGARHVFAPSADTAARLTNYFPALPVEVRPHTPPLPPAQQPDIFPPAKRRLRVGLIGAIGGHKGYDVLLDCARDAAARRLPLEFVVIGFTANDKKLLETGKVFITGRYNELEAQHLVRRERPDVYFLPSVWPETWCYALDYAMAQGLPVFAFDLGAIAERLRDTGLGRLLPLDLSSRQINNHLLGRVAARQNPGPYVQIPQSFEVGDAKMAQDRYAESNVMKPPVGESSPEEGLSASVQVLPLPTGLYLFSVKAAAPLAENSAGQLSLPAMHVGLGPGVRSDQVEFVAGPGNSGSWLFAQGDVLVVKVNGSGATLILTSVRSSMGEVLSIGVERLESRAQAAASLPAESANVPSKAPVPAPRAADAPPATAKTAEPAGDAVPLQIKTHIRSRGDVNFADVPWAGRVAPGLWIESFSVQPLKHLGAQHVEYKALTGTGFETPWLSDDQICGTKGMSVPLVGFAVRLRPGPETAAYDCEYSGYYRSSVTVGPLRNGAPCRSTVANDPLEGLQIRIVKRASPAGASAGAASAAGAEQRPGPKAPSFGRYRDAEGAIVNGDSKPAVAEPKAAKRIKAADASSKAERSSRSANRTPTRFS